MKTLLVICFGLVCFAGCSKKKISTDTTDTPSADDASTESSPLYLNLISYYEGTTSADQKSAGSCIVPKNTVAGSTESNITCSVSIPEAQLYYSNLDFKIGTSDSNYCAIISFKPYYYLRSTSATFKPYPSSTDVVDCTDPSLEARCWGGAAPIIAPEFPKNFGTYFLPIAKSSTSYTLTSSNSRRQSNTDKSLTTNTNVTNNLPSALRNTSDSNANYGGDGTFQDYVVECKNKWGENLYTITLTISDEDYEENGTPQDTYYDWGQ